MAVPLNGWGMHYRLIVWIYYGLGAVAVVTISLVTYLFVNRGERLAHLVEQRTRELNQSNQTLITVLEGIDADVYVADFDTNEVLFANKHLRDSFNDSLVGQTCYEIFRCESTICANCKNKLLLDTNGQPTGVYVWEGQNPVTKQWYKNADRAIWWEGGRCVHLQIATDITEWVQTEQTLLETERELKALLQEKDILLAEVHHRVKNNLQVIISLLNLQSSGIEDENLQKVYEESRNRIKSMALVHEQLYRSKEYARIEFGEYIDHLATTLLNTYNIDDERIQLHVAAKNVYIDLERAIPCGLLLNELITNSLKYAFPDKRKGQIWVWLQPEGNQMVLKYSDDGIGMPVNLDLENSHSLGMQLVRLLTVHDLQGNLEFGNGHNKRGAHFSIVFPMANGNEKLL